MSKGLTIFNLGMVASLSDDREKMQRELMACSEAQADDGRLSITPQQASALLDVRRQSLNDNGRIELGLGALPLLMERFSRSSYLDASNYASSLGELLDLFYYYKTETRDTVPDAVLADRMFDWFENKYHGSMELMTEKEFSTVHLRRMRIGAYDEDDEDNEDNEDENPDNGHNDSPLFG